MIKRALVMKKIRAGITENIGQLTTYSDKRKNSQRIKLYGVSDALFKAEKIGAVVNNLGYTGIEVYAHFGEWGNRSIVINFDNALYN